MNQEQARKELQGIFLKELKYSKNVQWKSLNRAVFLLEKFPCLASERFMAKRNRGNKPRYPLFLLAEHGAKLKQHIEPVYNLDPKILSSERQTYGQEKNPESVHILQHVNLEVLRFLWRNTLASHEIRIDGAALCSPLCSSSGGIRPKRGKWGQLFSVYDSF
jgi:hypothetical protein